MYKGLEAELHDVFWEAEAPGVELELIKNHLSETKQKVLEVGCGSGRILLPLLDVGYSVDGLDTSQDMLDLLEKNKQSQHNCELIYGEVTEVDLKPYRHVIIPAFTLMLMGEHGGKEALSYIAENTAKGSSIYFTVFIPWAEICGELEEEQWYKDHEAENASGAKARCDTRFTIDRTRQLLHREHKYTLRNKESHQKAKSEQTLRWYTYQEMLVLLESAGWSIEQSIFDFSPDGDGENAHILTVVAINK